MATLIRIDGTTVEVDPINGSVFSLEEMQTAVGGDIEMLAMTGNRYMLVNEEGLVRDFPQNKEASKTLTNDWKVPVRVFGHVMIINKNQIN